MDVYKVLNKIDLANIDKLFDGYISTNALPTDVVLAPSVDNFKSSLNKHWNEHLFKFEASCYIPGVRLTLVTQRRNASSKATEWPA